MVWILAASMQLHQASPADDAITFAARAARLERLLPQLGAATNSTLKCSSELENQVALISVHSMPKGTVLKLLAQACGGEWRIDPDGSLTLWRPATLRRAEAAAEFKNLRDGYARGIANYLRRSAVASELTAEGADKVLQDLNSSDSEGDVPAASSPEVREPGGRAIARILAGIDPGTLAAIAPDTRVVFSSNPNRLQRFIGGHPGAVLREFAKEQAVWSAAVARSRGSRSKSMSDPEQQSDPSFSGPLDETPQRFELSVARPSSNSDLELELRIEAADGEVVNLWQSDLDVDSPQESEPSEQLKSTKLELSPESQAIEAVLRYQTGSPEGESAPISLTPEVRKRILRPDIDDPLSFVPADVLLQLAKVKGLDLVACMPDDLLAADPINGADLAVALQEAAPSISIYEQDGALLVRPKDWLRLEAERLDRKRFGALMNIADEDDTIRLAKWAEYSLSNPDPNDQLAGEFLMAVTGLDEALSHSGESWTMLQLYGLLLPTQLQALNAGGHLRYADLTEAQRNLLSYYVFGSADAPGVRNEGTLTVQPEVTDIFPQGLSDVDLSWTTESFRVALGVEPRIGSPQSAQELGSIAGVREHDLTQVGRLSSLAPYTRFRYGTETQMSVYVALGSGDGFSDQLSDDEMLPGANYTLTNLPSDFMDAYRQAEQRVLTSTRRQRGKATPPPRR